MPPELVNVEVSKMAVLHGYIHFMGQPAVKVITLLVGFWLALPERVKEGVTHLLPCPHWFVSEKSKRLLWAGLMRSHIGSTGLAEIAIPAPVLTPIYSCV